LETEQRKHITKKLREKRDKFPLPLTVLIKILPLKASIPDILANEVKIVTPAERGIHVLI